jgi:hypothetical protein
MPTTTFIDVKFTEDIDRFVYENTEYNFSQGETVSMPRHIGFSFVNKQDVAEWAADPYEIKDSEYGDVLMRTRESGDEDRDVETCEVEKSDGEVCGREKPCPYHGDEE